MVCCCFTGDTVVLTKNDGPKRIDSLKPFEKILTLRGKDGSRKWTSFFAYVHKEDNVPTEFISFRFSNGTDLKVTGEHLIYMSGSKGERIPRMARNIVEGDKLFFSPEEGKMTFVEVTEKGTEMGQGFYAPLTFTGDFLANGILVTCYGDISDFSRAHQVFAPLRLWNKIRKSKKETSGLHGYAQGLIKVREMLPNVISSKYA